MEFAPLLIVATLVLKGTDFVKHVRAGLAGEGWNGAVTQVTAWAVGVAVTFLVATTMFAAAIPVADGVTLADTGLADRLVLGLVLSALGGTLYDGFAAVDRHRTSAKPHLVPPP